MVEWIEYKGQRLPFLYNNYAISCTVSNREEKGWDAKWLHYITYYSIEAGCNEMNKPFKISIEGEEREITLKDAGFIVGKLGPEQINDLIKKFAGEPDTDTVDDSKKK